jgi:hypothetical protein
MEETNLEYACELSLRSYNIARKQLDKIDNTIASFTAWVTAINVALIGAVLSKTGIGACPPSPFRSCLFYMAMVYLAITIVIAIAVKIWGELIQLDHAMVQASRETVIENANRHRKKIFRIAKCKRRLLFIIDALVFVEMVFLVSWFIGLS